VTRCLLRIVASSSCTELLKPVAEFKFAILLCVFEKILIHVNFRTVEICDHVITR
jgi:hypothetical protein